MVRVAVWSQQTFPTQHPFYGRQENCPLLVSQLDQLSLLWIMEVETIKTANYGYMWLYGPRPKSVTATLELV